jgi:Tfp pilus assembly protein PilN
MINLMPPAHKQSVLYARRNTFLIRWVMGLVVVSACLVVVTGGGLFYLKQDTSANQKTVDQTKADLKAQKEDETLARVSEMSSNLKLVVDVLSNEIMFSKLLQQMAQVMPPGTVLQNLSLKSTLSGGMDLEIAARSYEDGVRAQVNLADPQNAIFQKADIGEVSCVDAGAAQTAGYPCTAKMRVLFAKDSSPFLKLNQGKAAQ